MKTLAAFQNIHQGETILVCGCGESLNDLAHPERFITIGVNDVGRKFDSTYLLVLNPRSQFKGDRFRYVEQSRAQVLFTQLDLGIHHPHIVRFKLGQSGGTDFSDPNVLHHTQNSPYVGVCLAVLMGAKRIGLVGVDFTDHHFFAQTGTHSLSRQLTTIDAQYRRLGEALQTRDVEVFNLSRASRLTAFPKMSVEEFTSLPRLSAKKKKIFFVNYKFLSCGDVFRDGLRHAAEDINIEYAEAYWDDARLPDKVKQFSPDLLFVVHGRMFSKKWGQRFKEYHSAVWLLDEPYEVDDTSKFSGLFNTVYVNDPNTIKHHKNAHHLPVCYDPHAHFDIAGPRKHDVGFIGGYNAVRQKALEKLYREGLLSYVVGGPWRGDKLNKICLSRNIPACETANLYQQTNIVLNVFREVHHFNTQKIPAHSLNPRVYEALACGALVVSENRPEVKQTFPNLPVFKNDAELVDIVKELLKDKAKYDRIKSICLQQLQEHTFANRLKTVVQISLGGKKEKEQPPTYSIIMVAHNAREMTQMSTLGTLRHSAGHDARLIVVDNASTDGTQEWLDVMAQRGDIDLIRNKTNIGHGPGLELARRGVRSRYIVTLDSDAFPLTDDWLPRLRARLEAQVKVVGIQHHRGYIHPSCLMIARQTLEEFDLSFLNEKDQPSRLDVAERISSEIKRHGYQIAGLERTSAQQRGSVSEPVYLGSEYEGIVYHQWYTTRSVMAAGGPVDDVSPEAIQCLLRELFEKYQAEPRDITIVMGVRAGPSEAQRLRNAKACLQALNLQDLPRWQYRIVVVEQDRTPQLEAALAPLADRYIFAYNPGSYNRGWAFNIGASLPGSKTGVLCLIDADLLVPPDFLRCGLIPMRTGRRAVLPYSEIVYLDRASTGRAIQDRLAVPMRSPNARDYHGRVFTTSQGGCIWVEAALYQEIGGYDERFRGWGREDREFWDRLTRITTVGRLPERLLHLDHPQPAMDDHWAIANRQLYEQLSAARVTPSPRPIGDLALYVAEERHAPVEVTQPPPGKRDWENWHTWDPTRIERIVRNERRPAVRSSARRHLAEILVRLGESLLDLGCGPGALWPHFESYRQRFSWVGMDVTHEMLAVAHRLFPKVPVYRADVDKLPFKNTSFDVVLLRHVLEHLPPWLMESALTEAIRVARRAVVVDFYVPPVARSDRHTTQVGANFLETRWTIGDLEVPITKADWLIRERFTLTGRPGESDEIWILRSSQEGPLHDHAQGVLALSEPVKVSIIMPTYRRPHTIYRTVEMIRAQRYHNWELIIIDNAGDGDYHFDDPRIRVYCHNEQTSASYARNQGLRYVSGELVCFFDDDDDMFPTYLERFATTFQANPNAKMVRCGMIVSKNGRTNFSYATPECCLRRQFATPTWSSNGPGQDQRYFRGIISAHSWSERKGEIITIREALCHANADSIGGLRSGKY